MTTRSGRSYRKSGEMASEELASFLYNLVCRYLVYYIIFECLYLSGLSCVLKFPSKSGELKDFIPSKSVELNFHHSGSLHLVAAVGFKSTV